ncbi:Crp/Fnr family transcriptional regulator [Gaetbulibacter saemankumensis]|uniref:Crp/Fnr family transcriptional regulator n=1 Tax=Gaetbulibacter saemankumensis TaxID=311208 RepID=UPI0004846287|nr:Crp/Fnr family transcriptional regulator [Gaetbulibacter saemankumensis]
MNEALSILLNKGTSKSYSKKEFIIRQGETSNKIYFVKHGVTRHYVLTRDGQEKTIRISLEQDFFYSSIVSYFKNEASYIYCQCLTDCDLIYWESSLIEELFKEYPDLETFKNQQLINFILEKHTREIALITQNAEGRYQQFCKTRLDLFNRIPHHIIASYLDITPETLSRLRSKKS